MESKQANQIPIEDIMEAYGRSCIRHYSGYDMYKSPFREEGHPSFQVVLSSNTWKDFGSGEFGSAIDLVMKMEKCSFKEAIQLFDTKKFGENFDSTTREKRKEREVVSKVTISKIAPLVNKTLLSYLKDQRGIDASIATQFCKEVYYKQEGSDKNFFAVAFMNDSGGIEYRNGAGYKGSFISKDITRINNDNDRCAVFEGFMDFLSYLQIMKNKPDKQKIDFIILNSTSMVNKAISIIQEKGYKTINCFIDNDAPGRAAFNKIKESCNNSIVVNESARVYPTFKDLNQFWTDQLKKKQAENLRPDNNPKQDNPKSQKGIKL